MGLNILESMSHKAVSILQHKFLFQYDDPEITEWFANQPRGSKAKALEQALNIIIANYGTGNFMKAVAKKEVLNTKLNGLMLSEENQNIQGQNNRVDNNIPRNLATEASKKINESKNNTSPKKPQKGGRLDLLSDL